MRSNAPVPGAADFARAARAYVGVRWRHLGRSPERGLDCVGLVVRAAHDVGLAPGVDYTGYRRRPDGTMLRQALARHLVRVTPGRAAVGDVLLFAGSERLPCHLAVVSAARRTGAAPPRLLIVHAWADYGRVVEHRLADFSGGAPIGCYRFPEFLDAATATPDPAACKGT